MPFALTRDEAPNDFLRFRWYRWKRGFAVESHHPAWATGRISRLQEAYLAPVGGGPVSDAEVYYPLEENPGISREFAALGTRDEVLAFANRYGWLGLEEDPAYELRRVDGQPFGEKIRDWLTEAGYLKRGFKVWDLIEAGDVRGLAKIIFRHGDYIAARFTGNPRPPFYFEIPILTRLRNPGWLKMWKPNDRIGPAKLFLADTFNKRLHGRASLSLGIDVTGEFRPHARPINLLAAMWLQFSQVVTGTRSLKPCRVCGKIMDVTENRRHKQVHAQCSLRVKMAKYRASLRKEKV